MNNKNARSPGEHPLPTISKNASSLSSAKYAFAHSNHTRNGANSDWRTPRMSSTFVWGRLCGSIETCSPLSPIGTWIKEGALKTPTSPSRCCCCCCCVMGTDGDDVSFRREESRKRESVCATTKATTRMMTTARAEEHKEGGKKKPKKEGKNLGSQTLPF